MSNTNNSEKAAGSAATGSPPGSTPGSTTAGNTAHPKWTLPSKPTQYPIYRKGMPPGWTSGHSPEAWAAAVLFYSRGGRLPEKYDPVGLFPGGLFETAEDVQRLLDLDDVPETIETVTVPKTGEEPKPLKYCWVALKHMVSIREVAVVGEYQTMIISGGPDDGKLRDVEIHLGIRDDRQLIDGKVPPFR